MTAHQIVANHQAVLNLAGRLESLFGDPRVPERMWSRIAVDPDTGCWIWTGSSNRTGYGTSCTYAKGVQTNIRIHRFMYTTLVEQVPSSLDLDHLCRVRSCCHPGHLEPVTRLVNLLRGETIIAANARKTHCPAGHALEGRNVTYDGGRKCKECMRLRAAARRAARRAEQEAS